jgi:hypothetical protein
MLVCSTTAGGPCHHVGIITHLSEDACLQITANVLSDMFHRTRVSYTVDLNHRPGNVVCIIGDFGGIPAWFLSPGYPRRSGQNVSDLDDVSVLSSGPNLSRPKRHDDCRTRRSGRRKFEKRLLEESYGVVLGSSQPISA